MRQVDLTIGAFPDRVLLRGFEGGAVFTAERDGKFYVVQDEGTLAELLPEEDRVGTDPVKVLEFETAAARATYITDRGWDRDDRTVDSADGIRRAISEYSRMASGEHHRYRSWEHCYGFFRRTRPTSGFAADRDPAALQLAFYLASWGMYRGSSFLLQYSYTVHRPVIDLIAETRFEELWETDFGASETDDQLVPCIDDLTSSIRKAYAPFAEAAGFKPPTDTLVTKVVLGTFGCLPACDQYFIRGFKLSGLQYSRLNSRFIERVLTFCQVHRSTLQEVQSSIEKKRGVRYPLMKLVDMFFWQTGSHQGKGA